MRDIADAVDVDDGVILADLIYRSAQLPDHARGLRIGKEEIMNDDDGHMNWLLEGSDTVVAAATLIGVLLTLYASRRNNRLERIRFVASLSGMWIEEVRKSVAELAGLAEKVLLDPVPDPSTIKRIKEIETYLTLKFDEPDTRDGAKFRGICQAITIAVTDPNRDRETVRELIRAASIEARRITSREWRLVESKFKVPRRTSYHSA